MRVTDITMGPAQVAALRKQVDQHKYDHGAVLVLSGPAGATGAARLAARGALRIGAGLVTIGAPHDAVAEVAAQVTAIMVRGVEDVGAALADTRINAVCIGPGHGTGARCRDHVLAVLAAGRGTVLDADALTSFATAPEVLFAATHGRPVVLTPHDGEFRRLFPDLSLADRAAACMAAATRAGCVVLLKGSATLVAGARLGIHNRGGARAAPWLATAGAGDVLAGFITGLMARGFAPQAAAETAVWLHAEAARHVGPGLIAEDLPEAMPAIFRQLGV